MGPGLGNLMSIQVTPIPRLTVLTTPAFTLGTVNTAGSAITGVASDSTLLTFDGTLPDAITFGQSGATGSATVASRRDHSHAMANPLVAQGEYTGDGSEDLEVTGTGFTPKAVWIVIKRTSDQAATQEFFCTPSILDDTTGAGLLHGSATQGHRIDQGKFVSFDANGFSVSDHAGDEDPNKLNEVYNYLAIG